MVRFGKNGFPEHDDPPKVPQTIPFAASRAMVPDDKWYSRSQQSTSDCVPFHVKVKLVPPPVAETVYAVSTACHLFEPDKPMPAQAVQWVNVSPLADEYAGAVELPVFCHVAEPNTSKFPAVVALAVTVQAEAELVYVCGDCTSVHVCADTAIDRNVMTITNRFFFISTKTSCARSVDRELNEMLDHPLTVFPLPQVAGRSWPVPPQGLAPFCD
jgi:hypothetical protein